MKWSKKIENFILDKMCDGMHPAKIFKIYSDKLPDIRTFNRRQVSDPEFKEKVDAAYTVIYQTRMAELDELTSKLASELRPDADFKEVEAWRRSRIDVLKFDLGKMAPNMAKRFDKASKVEVSGKLDGPKFTVINYHKPEERLIEQTIKDQED